MIDNKLTEADRVVICYATMGHGGFEYESAWSVMERLGVEYERATPQSVIDAVVFYNCKKLPTHLPDYMRAYND